MTQPRTIGNRIAPPRFLIFLAALIFATPVAAYLLGSRTLGAMAGFDLAAILFLLLSAPLLGTSEAAAITKHAQANDANRHLLLALTAIVMTVLLIAIAAEAVGRTPQPFTRILIIATLIVAWLFSNSVYALHYAHLAYRTPGGGCARREFPGTRTPPAEVAASEETTHSRLLGAHTHTRSPGMRPRAQ
jgi:uncharacterized membrane protein